MTEEQELEFGRALDICIIAEELIDFIIEKYGVKSLEDFTCPIHRRLAVALNKFPQRQNSPDQ